MEGYPMTVAVRQVLGPKQKCGWRRWPQPGRAAAINPIGEERQIDMELMRNMALITLFAEGTSLRA